MHILPNDFKKVMNNYMYDDKIVTLKLFTDLIQKLLPITSKFKEDILLKLTKNISIAKNKSSILNELMCYVSKDDIHDCYNDIISCYETDCFTLLKKQLVHFITNAEDLKKTNVKIDKNFPADIKVEDYVKDIFELKYKNFTNTKFIKMIKLLPLMFIDKDEDEFVKGLISIFDLFR